MSNTQVTVELPEMTPEYVGFYIKEFLKEQFKGEAREMLKESIKEMIEDEVGKDLRRQVRSFIAEFVSDEGLIVDETENSITKISLRQSFDDLIKGSAKYRTKELNNGQLGLERDSYGVNILDALFQGYLKEKTDIFISDWMALNKEIIKSNLSTVVSNNIKKELFGTKLPDEKLMSIADDNK